MAYMNTERLYNKIKAANLDAFVIFKPENFYYTTGFQNYYGGVATGVVRHAHAIVVIPADETLDPTMIINSWEEVQARENAWFKDIRSFPTWIEIFYLQDLLENRTKFIKKPVQYDMERNIIMLIEILREKGLENGRLGIELDYISQKAFSLLIKYLPKAHFVDSSDILFDIQAVKTAKEIEILTEATRMTQKATLALTEDNLHGASVGEIKLRYQLAALKEAAANPSLGFQEAKMSISIGSDFSPKISNISYRAAMGDIIFLDVGVILKGYQADIGRSMVVGKPNDFQKKINSILKKGLENMLFAIKPGAKCCDIFNIGEKTIHEGGLDSYARGHLGHAVGVGKHERPPFIAPSDETILEPGMVLSIETPLYIHGAGGFMIEDTIVTTDDGYDLLSDWPRDLIEVS